MPSAADCGMLSIVGDSRNAGSKDLMDNEDIATIHQMSQAGEAKKISTD
jgi:hypothetical protein